jgi:hypothetical protein
MAGTKKRIFCPACKPPEHVIPSGAAQLFPTFALRTPGRAVEGSLFGSTIQDEPRNSANWRRDFAFYVLLPDSPGAGGGKALNHI